MKKGLKLFGLIAFMGVMTLMMQSCGSKGSNASASTSEVKTVSASQEVKMIYFHATRRCATCEAVEEVTKQTLAKHFENKIPFESLNREEDQNKALVEKYKVGGQTLLLLTGDKVVNLTNDAFLYAGVKPEKFEEILVKKINTIL